jgi:hypothetical protein
VRIGRRLPLLAALVAIALVVASAPAAERVQMQALLNDDGTGRLLVNTAGGPWSWEVCAPDLSRCAPFKRGRIITTAGAPARSVFRVSGEGAIGLSPLWKGRVRSVVPPSVRGIVRANERVTPIAGRWRHGWEGDAHALQLAACVTATGRECTTLTHSHFVDGCRHEAAVLDPVFTGHYLRVADRRLGAGPIVEAAYGLSSPYGFEVWRRNRVTAVAMIGRIGEATGPRTVSCGAPTLAEAP